MVAGGGMLEVWAYGDSEKKYSKLICYSMSLSWQYCVRLLKWLIATYV